MSILAHIDMDITFRTSAALAGYGSALSALEYRASLPLFADDGIVAWQVLKLHHPLTWRGLGGRIAEFFLGSERFRIIVWMRLASALLVLGLALVGTVPWPPLLILLLSTAAVNVRSAFGLDGSYQMLVVVLGASLLATVAPQGSIAREACLWFIAVQLILSYAIAGISKLRSPTWRAGSALVGIFSTATYGHPALFRMLRRYPQAGLLGCWATIVFEMVFPVILIVPDEMALCLATVGFCFHVGTALFMGLNGFLIAFISAYPALLFVVSRLHAGSG